MENMHTHKYTHSYTDTHYHYRRQSQAWWQVSVIPTLKRQENRCKFEASLNYRELDSKQKKKKEKQRKRKTAEMAGFTHTSIGEYGCVVESSPSIQEALGSITTTTKIKKTTIEMVTAVQEEASNLSLSIRDAYGLDSRLFTLSVQPAESKPWCGIKIPAIQTRRLTAAGRHGRRAGFSMALIISMMITLLCLVFCLFSSLLFLLLLFLSFLFFLLHCCFCLFRQSYI